MTDYTAEPKPKRRDTDLRVITLLALLTIAAGVILYMALDDDKSPQSPGSDSSRVQGVLSLRPGGSFGGDGSETGGDTCRSSDVAEGTAVVVSNGKGDAIAVGRLGPGKLGDPNINNIERCTFGFAVDVPLGHSIYRVTITDLVDEEYTEAELFGGPYTAKLTYRLGSS
jgi:hypothetical protein